MPVNPALTSAPQHGTQCRQAALNVHRVAGVTHQANAPLFARQFSQSSADFQIEFPQQTTPNFGVIDTLRDTDGVELWQAPLGGHRHLQSHAFQSCHQLQVVVPVPFEARLQSFLPDNKQCLMQRIKGIHRCRVVVGALAVATPVTHDQLHIQKPALHSLGPLLDTVYRCRAEGHG